MQLIKVTSLSLVVHGFQAYANADARGNLSNLFHRKCSLNLNSNEVEITNYCAYKIYIYPPTKQSSHNFFLFITLKLSHMKDTLLQKHH
jgi:hypothetical protein